MVENFDSIVEVIEENAEEKLQSNVISIDGSEPDILVTLDKPTELSRREFLQKLGGEIEQAREKIAFSFLDATQSKVDGEEGVRYRIKVKEIDENPLSK